MAADKIEFLVGDLVRFWDKELSKSRWGFVVSVTGKTVMVGSSTDPRGQRVKLDNVRFPKESDGDVPVRYRRYNVNYAGRDGKAEAKSSVVPDTPSIHQLLIANKLKAVLIDARATVAGVENMDDGAWALATLQAKLTTLPTQETRELVIRLYKEGAEKGTLHTRDTVLTSAEATGKYMHVPLHQWGKGKVKLPTNWHLSGKRVSFSGVNGIGYLTIEDTGRYSSRTTHKVTLDLGQWPTNEELITICDGGIPPKVNHFGGVTTPDGPTVKRVTVYTD